MALNKTMVITGGASGIGLAIAREAIERGSNVVLMDIDADALAAAQAALPPGRAAAVAADVAAPAGHEEAIRVAIEAFGQLDAWINNAGLARHALIPDVTEAQIDTMISVNLKGTLLGSQAALKHFIPNKAGDIINIISTASLRGIPSESVYCATKWAVRGFTQALQEEAAAYGIRATAILPGGVDTPFWDNARDHDVARDAMLPPESIARFVMDCLLLPPGTVVREVQVRGIQDRDFGR